MTSYSAHVQLPIAQVWEHLIYKIEHPENFVPGVTQVTILEKTPEQVTRSMELHLPDGNQAQVIENITHTPYLVRFTLVHHPVYTGYVDNLAETITENETRLTYTMHWVNKITGEPMANAELIKNAVLKSIDYMVNGATNPNP
jgi:hypothetical protein